MSSGPATRAMSAGRRSIRGEDGPCLVVAAILGGEDLALEVLGQLDGGHGFSSMGAGPVVSGWARRRRDLPRAGDGRTVRAMKTAATSSAAARVSPPA